MWAVVVVFAALVAGPHAVAVTDAGTFKTESDCQAAIRAAVPSKLDAAAKAQFAKGERRYVCVRLTEDTKRKS
jgi:hypothetical protein